MQGRRTGSLAGTSKSVAVFRDNIFEDQLIHRELPSLGIILWKGQHVHIFLQILD